MIGFAIKLVKTITLKRVAIWAVAMIVGVVGYTVYENRNDLFLSTTSMKGQQGNQVGYTFTIGASTRKRIQNFVDGNSTVVGLAISSADIRLNTSRNILFSLENRPLEPAAKIENVQRFPLFSHSRENNKQVVKLINGEFFCIPFDDVLIAKNQLEHLKAAVFVCRASLPPYYGFFSGFVSVFLNKDPTIEEQFVIRKELESLATDIYFKDVIPSSKKVP